MIDLHNHLLPGIDDGAATVADALAMAKAFADQGVRVVACTPHIVPGLYHNTGPDIRQRVAALQAEIDAVGISLRLVPGADNHVTPNFSARLREGHLLTLADSRYVLVEPAHHIATPRLEDLFLDLLSDGYVPILTHPERLSWIETNYPLMQRLAAKGVWMQVTAGSLVGRFGSRVKYWAERMLCDGHVHVLASDAHDPKRRPPELYAGARAAEALLGAEEARHLVSTRPEGVVADLAPGELPPLPQPIVPAANAANDVAPPGASGRLAGVLRRLRGN